MIISYRLEWRPTPSSGVRSVVKEIDRESPCHADMEAVRKDVVDLAVRWGYRRPKWWQYWRWFETPAPGFVVVRAGNGE